MTVVCVQELFLNYHGMTQCEFYFRYLETADIWARRWHSK